MEYGGTSYNRSVYASPPSGVAPPTQAFHYFDNCRKMPNKILEGCLWQKRRPRAALASAQQQAVQMTNATWCGAK